MQTDKELLELAAKAAGINFRWNEPCGKVEELSADGWFVGFFEPLTDDGDALRLAVKLRFVVTVGANNVEARRWSGADIEHLELCCRTEAQGDDPCAATRRAIVRAAAYIGEKL